jgi:peptide/nickel transport system substrate-binding protein
MSAATVAPFRRRFFGLVAGGAASVLVVAACSSPAPAGSPAAATTAPGATQAVLANTPVVGGTPLSTFSTPVPSPAAAVAASPAPAGSPAAAAAASPKPAASPAVAAASPVAAAAPTPAGAAPKVGGTLHQALINEPDALDPHKTIQLIADSVNTHIYDRLVYIGRDRQPHPWVAEHWDISPDGTQITFTIRKGIKFHDGTDLDGAAVKANFDRILDPATASPAKAQMGTLTSVDLVDPSTVRFNFSEPYAPFFTNISLGYGGIVSPTAVQKYGDSFGHNPVGSGPFRMKQWDAGQQILLERNPDYKNYRDDESNKGPAYVDTLEYKFIPEAPTRLAALQSGELDISDVDVQQAPTIQGDPKFQLIVWKDALDMNFIEYANKAPFTDMAVRQAIASSIDRDSIVKTAWNSYATANLNPIPAGVAGWDQSIGQQYGYAFDLTKAKKYLTDGGYAPGADGVMAKDGMPLAFTMLVYSGNEPGKTAAEIIQSALNSIGMKVDIQIIEFGSELPQLRDGKFDVDWMRWTWPDPVIESLLFKSPGWTNQMNDPEVDKLTAVADKELDPAKRLAAVKDIQTYLLQKAYIAPIATDWILAAANTRVKGYEWDAIGYPMLVDVSLN